MPRSLRPLFSLSALALLLLLAPGLLAAQETEATETFSAVDQPSDPQDRDSPPAGASSPEELAELMFKAAQQEDFDRYAELMHPQALSDFHDLFSSLVKADPSGQVATQLFGLENPDAFDELAPHDSFVQVMAMLTQLPGMEGVFANMQGEAIGHVNEGDDQAFVVVRVRTEAAGLDFTQVDVVPARRDGDRWFGELTGEIKGLAGGLAQALGIDPSELQPGGAEPAEEWSEDAEDEEVGREVDEEIDAEIDEEAEEAAAPVFISDDEEETAGFQRP